MRIEIYAESESELEIEDQIFNNVLEFAIVGIGMNNNLPYIIRRFHGDKISLIGHLSAGKEQLRLVT